MLSVEKNFVSAVSKERYCKTSPFLKIVEILYIFPLFLQQRCLFSMKTALLALKEFDQRIEFWTSKITNTVILNLLFNSSLF